MLRNVKIGDVPHATGCIMRVYADETIRRTRRQLREQVQGYFGSAERDMFRKGDTIYCIRLQDGKPECVEGMVTGCPVAIPIASPQRKTKKKAKKRTKKEK